MGSRARALIGGSPCGSNSLARPARPSSLRDNREYFVVVVSSKTSCVSEAKSSWRLAKKEGPVTARLLLSLSCLPPFHSLFATYSFAPTQTKQPPGHLGHAHAITPNNVCHFLPLIAVKKLRRPGRFFPLHNILFLSEFTAGERVFFHQFSRPPHFPGIWHTQDGRYSGVGGHPVARYG